MDRVDRFRGCLLGLATGDALGTTVEFRPRGSFDPLTDLVGGGPFNLSPGQWTDDTSMALCLAASLVECGGFDARDQMERYCRWAERGEYSSTGTCFDIGRTVSGALARFAKTGDPWAGSTDPQSAGNGCIMRLAPIAMFFHAQIEDAERFGGESARTTHGAAECVDACRLFARILWRALNGASREETVLGDAGSFSGEAKIEAIARGEYRDKALAEIKGSGYVVQSLEAALWCFMRTHSFEEAVLAAANLGDDADTTAAVCGQIAGALHGLSGIPETWAGRIVMRSQILRLADQMAGRRTAG